MWARIENGTVAEITDLDPAGRFHPSLHWQNVDQAGGCAPGWAWDGKAFSAPAPQPVPTRTQIEAARLQAYADPLTGSDRYFAEAQRESLLGNTDAANAARALGMARFAEIQAEHPWQDE